MDERAPTGHNCAMRFSRGACGTLGGLCLIVAPAIGCSSSRDENRQPDELAAPDAAQQDPKAQQSSETKLDDDMQAPPVGSASIGEPHLDAGGAGHAGKSGSDADAGTGAAADAGASMAIDGGMSTAALAPELIEIWYFGWEGDNLSFFQIGLCADGVATYLFATGPNVSNPVRLTGHYVASDPNHLIADFVGTSPVFGSDLHFDLEYDVALDSLHRMNQPDDGYSAYGARFSSFSWSEPAATCPAM